MSAIKRPVYGASDKPIAMVTISRPEAEILELLQKATFVKDNPMGKPITFIYLEVGSPNWKKFNELLGELL